MKRPPVRGQRASVLTVTNRNVLLHMPVYWREILPKSMDCRSCPGVKRPVRWVAKRRAKGSGDVKTKYLCDNCKKKLPNDWLVAKYG